MMKERWFRGLCYYWVVDRAEYATDLIFTGREALAGLYPRLLDHAAVNFSAKDILCFLGRRFHPRFDGEVLTDCQKGRAARCTDQASGEEQLAEDVRQVRLGAADRDGDQRSAGVPRAAAADPRRSARDGVVPE